MEGITNALLKLWDRLPLKKLTGNQAFDLVADGLMIAFVIPVLVLVDLGEYQDTLKFLLILSVPIIIFWSFVTNK